MRTQALTALAFLAHASAANLTSVRPRLRPRGSPIVLVSVASPAGAAHAGAAVAVSWEFLPGHKPASGDFIGAFAPSGADGAPNLSAVTARQCLSAACRDSRPVPLTATGELNFGELVHSRTNYTYLYFSPQRCAGCWDIPALAFSRTIAFADENEPVGVHLSLTGRAGEAIVSFSTHSGQPAVKYGPSGGPLTNLAVGAAVSFAASDMCGAPANNSTSGDFIVPHSLNAVTLSGLRANHKFDYQAGTVNGSWGKRWTFTMPAVGGDAVGGDAAGSTRPHPLRMAVFGDMGQDLSYNDRVGSQPAATATLASILQQDPGIVLHIGDISYARGSGSMWPAFLQQVQGVAARAPGSGGRIVFRPRKSTSSYSLLKWGVHIPFLFHEGQTPRSDSANFEPLELILLAPTFWSPGRRHQAVSDGHREPRVRLPGAAVQLDAGAGQRRRVRGSVLQALYQPGRARIALRHPQPGRGCPRHCPSRSSSSSGGKSSDRSSSSTSGRSALVVAGAGAGAPGGAVQRGRLDQRQRAARLAHGRPRACQPLLHPVRGAGHPPPLLLLRPVQPETASWSVQCALFEPH